jgi:hypothetical protein
MPLALAQLDPARGDPCASGRHTAVLITYSAPQGRVDAEGHRVPLRCGHPDVGRHKGWGYRHFSRRLAGQAQSFSDDIATTFRFGHRERLDRRTVSYEHAWLAADGVAHRAMTVIVSLRPQQPDGRIRGIITAFWWDRPELDWPRDGSTGDRR